MENEIEVKIYSKQWLFKQQINLRNITSDINFQEELNWWQGNLTLEITWNLDNFIEWDIIEIRHSDFGNYYTGIIEDIDIVEYETTQVLNITFYGIFTCLNDILYKSSWLRKFTTSWTPGQIVKNIIDSFNSDYWTLLWETQILNTNIVRYTADSIDITWTSININYDNQNCLDAIKKALENSWMDFYIWVDWICYITKKVNQSIKFLTFWKEILNIKRKRTKKDLINKYYLEINWGWENSYSYATSISTYWLKEQKESKTEINNTTTQDLQWNQKISDFKLPKNQIQILINQDSSIIPWQLVTTMNTINIIEAQQILKIDKNFITNTLYLWDFQSFWKTVLKR